jgi:hypothetical protein
MEIRPVGAELFHADRQTDMIQLIVVFRDIAKAPEEHWRWVCASWARETVEASLFTR